VYAILCVRSHVCVPVCAVLCVCIHVQFCACVIMRSFVCEQLYPQLDMKSMLRTYIKSILHTRCYALKYQVRNIEGVISTSFQCVTSTSYRAAGIIAHEKTASRYYALDVTHSILRTRCHALDVTHLNIKCVTSRA